MYSVSWKSRTPIGACQAFLCRGRRCVVRFSLTLAGLNRDGLITWEEFAAAARKEPALLEELGIAGLV